MGNKIVDWVFRRQKFCCCIPVRFAVLVLSFISLLVSGLLSLILWYEVAINDGMYSLERDGLIAGGLIETLLFVASICGFVGSIVRKQLFVMIYSYFLYAHFVLNIALAIFLLWMIEHVKAQDIVDLCESGFQNAGTAGQCSGLLNITSGVFIAVVMIVLAIELYWAIVVSRYGHQLKSEKRFVRESRMLSRQSGFSLIPHNEFDDAFMLNRRSSGYPGGDPRTPYSGDKDGDDFNPYGPYNAQRGETGYEGYVGEREGEVDVVDAEEGYGGGRWTLEEIEQQEKVRRMRSVTESTAVDDEFPALPKKEYEEEDPETPLAAVHQVVPSIAGGSSTTPPP